MTPPPQDQSDRLLWMLGGAVAIVVGVSAALFLWPAAEDDQRAEVATVATPVPTPPPAIAGTPSDGGDDALSDRLDRARLAFDAGMLLEPAGYSAWSLYSAILARYPNQPAAAEGLAAVAGALVDRARLAASEGRDGEADALVARVLARFPEHPDALALRDRTRESATITATAPARRRTASPEPADTSVAPEPRVDVARRPSREPAITLTIAPNDRVDRVLELYPEFVRALAAGTLVTPPEQSAEHFVDAMRRIDPVHRMTRDAERQLFDALLARHDAAFDELDIVSALEWLDVAERMSVDSARIAAARGVIADFVAERAAHDIVAASDLTMLEYVAPAYPSIAQRREIEGWVDIEFMLGTDGTPRNVTATESSSSMFAQEAVTAASKWRFEPYRIMGHAVEQRVRTRIRFAFE
jgi:TonB family protein